MQIIQRAFLLILCALNVQNGQKCTLNTRIHFEEPAPVVLRDGKLLEPTNRFGDIELNYGDILTMSCGTGVLLHPNAQRQISVATITCEGGEMFRNAEWLNEPARFSHFKCTSHPEYRSRRTDRTCYDNNPIIEVGYSVENQFYPVYETCFNQAGLNPIYSKYTQKPYNAFYQFKVERPFFLTDDNFGFLPMKEMFSPNGLRTAVEHRVGQGVNEYVTKTQKLSRGHLAAKTDFVLAFGERASFHYVNCAPQWTGFNGGNWNTLEVDLRNHIHDVGYDTIIYTGTFGISQLMNDMGRPVDLYLHLDDNNNPQIPVPQFFYKVVYDPSTKFGIAFVGINNPYYSQAAASRMFFCEDVCEDSGNFNWLSWDQHDPEAEALDQYFVDPPKGKFAIVIVNTHCLHKMQVTPILITLAVISVVHTAWVTRIPKPKLNSLVSKKLESLETPKYKLPEERRKFSLFPKSYIKYVISPEPIYKIATHKPVVHGTKKPLMKKFHQLDTKKNFVENEVEEPTANEDSMYKLTVTPKEASIEVVEENSVSNEKHNDDSEEEDKPHDNDSHEIKMTTVDIEHKESLTLKDLIFPLTEKFVEATLENKSVEPLVDVSNANENSKESDTPDSKEFIFVDPAHDPTEPGKTSSEESEEFVTTEYYEEPEIVRRKRGSNVIEEENLASTVAGYKYTWHDRRLNNDVAFKNIHS
ncbi:hypothetical protein PYW07_006316 [Mythimna separata]|uniref:DNA/RNA non-specific endonuclease/pyrophosphatase/phosphodiesterase domain-containing protein n=1 Tax=Mythimna separata TaxID=271217 RepID=A0AAD7YUH4_MYTSE|nr:hypothetical protein PYW07_006316 [Mythimna separata]